MSSAAGSTVTKIAPALGEAEREARARLHRRRPPGERQGDRPEVAHRRGEGEREHRQVLAGDDLHRAHRCGEQRLQRAALLLAGGEVERGVESRGRHQDQQQVRQERRGEAGATPGGVGQVLLLDVERFRGGGSWPSAVIRSRSSSAPSSWRTRETRRSIASESTFVESASTRMGMLGPDGTGRREQHHVHRPGRDEPPRLRLGARPEAPSRRSTTSARASRSTAARAPPPGTGPHAATRARVRSSSPRLSVATEPSSVKSSG